MDSIVSTLGILLDIFETNTGTSVMWDRDEEPDDAGNDEEYGGEEETVVIAEHGDCGGGGEGTSGAGDFVEDMLDEVR